MGPKGSLAPGLPHPQLRLRTPYTLCPTFEHSLLKEQVGVMLVKVVNRVTNSLSLCRPTGF